LWQAASRPFLIHEPDRADLDGLVVDDDQRAVLRQQMIRERIADGLTSHQMPPRRRLDSSELPFFIRQSTRPAPVSKSGAGCHAIGLRYYHRVLGLPMASYSHDRHRARWCRCDCEVWHPAAPSGLAVWHGLVLTGE
jgi:hypothetical protein